MMRLTVEVVDAHASAATASPGITLRLRISEPTGVSVHAVALRCHTRVEPRGRKYAPAEQARLYELFGHISQWDRTLRSVTWAQTSILVPSFAHRIDVDLPIACTYDLEVASAKYFHAIREGDIPLVLLFSGMVFRAAQAGEDAPPALMVEPIPWDLEVSYRLPAKVWYAAMDQFFPGGGWLRLQRETMDRLQAFRGRHAVVTWDEAINLLLEHATEEEIV